MGEEKDKKLPPDHELWRKVTKDVQPLKSRALRDHPAAVRAKDEKPKGKPPRGETPPAPRIVQPGPPPRPPKMPPPPPLGHGDIAGLDRRTAERMKRGRLPIDGRLDLHGLTQVEAQRALLAFLDAGQAAGRRCLLVITGKGGLGEEGGVLRRNVPHWLNLPGFREKVLAYDYAQPRDGGQGALYVLLRRRKP